MDRNIQHMLSCKYHLLNGGPHVHRIARNNYRSHFCCLSCPHAQTIAGDPYNKLAWLTGDLPFLIRTAKETGRFSKAFDLSAEKLGPICQVGPTNFLLPSNVFLGEDRHWHGQFLAQQNNWFGAGCDCHFCKSVAHPG